MVKNEIIDGYQLGNDGKWYKEFKISFDYYQVFLVIVNVYDVDGEKFFYIL